VQQQVVAGFLSLPFGFAFFKDRPDLEKFHKNAVQRAKKLQSVNELTKNRWGFWQ
jgi:hypothetical protein